MVQFRAVSEGALHYDFRHKKNVILMVMWEKLIDISVNRNKIELFHFQKIDFL